MKLGKALSRGKSLIWQKNSTCEDVHGYVLFIKLFEIVPFSWEVPPAGDLSSKVAWSDGASRTGAMQGARLAVATPPMMAVAREQRS